jgi:hypothetical protein
MLQNLVTSFMDHPIVVRTVSYSPGTSFMMVQLKRLWLCMAEPTTK